MIDQTRVRNRPLAFLAALAIAGTAAIAGPIAIAPGASAAPFDPNVQSIFVSQGSTPTQLFEGETDTDGTIDFNAIGAGSGRNYNALAFNTDDNYLYATVNGNINGANARDIIRIEDDGSWSTTGCNTRTITNDRSPMVTGTYGEGLYWISPNQSPIFYGIDLTDCSLKRSVQTTYGNADALYAYGYLWVFTRDDGGNTVVSRISTNPATAGDASTSTLNIPFPEIPGAAFGAQWLYGNGNFGIYANDGNLYQVAVSDPTGASPTFEVIATQSGDPQTTNDGASNPGRSVDLKMTKVATDDATDPGGLVTFTLTVENMESSISSTGFVVRDVLPAGFAFDETSLPPSCSFNDSTNTLTCTSPALAAGAARDFVLTGTYDTAAAPTCFDNSASVLGNERDSEPANNEDSDEVCVRNLELTKAAEVRDGTVTYTVTATNTGGAPYGGDNLAAFVDDLGGVLDDSTDNNDITTAYSGYSGSGSPSDPADASASLTDTTLAWSGPLQPGETATVTYSVSLDDVVVAGDASLANEVCADVTGVSECAQTTTGVPRLSLEKSVSSSVLPDPNSPNPTLTYTITVTNTGTADYTEADPAKWVDDLGDVLDAATLDPASVTASAGAASVDGSTLSWSGPLAAGAEATVSYTVTYTGTDDSSVQNQVCVAEGIYVSATLERCDQVALPAGDLQVHKTVDPAHGTAVDDEQVLTYTLTFDNTYGEGAADVYYTDDLSGILDDAALLTAAPITSEPAGLSAALDGQSLLITGTVGAEEKVTISYQVQVDASLAGNNELSNILHETHEEPDCAEDPADDERLCTTNPVNVPDLTATKSAAPASGSQVAPGEEVTYTLTFDNTGGTAPAAVSHTDHLSGVIDDAEITSGPTAQAGLTVSAISDGTFEVTGIVPAGESLTVTYTATVLNRWETTGDETLLNVVVPTGTTPPTTCDADSVTCTTHPLDVPPYAPAIDLTKTAGTPLDVNGSGLVDAGDTIEFAFTVRNSGNVPLTAVSVSDPMLQPEAISCSPTSLEVGGEATCGPITYTITAADVAAGEVTNTATATGTDPAGTETTGTGTTTTTGLAAGEPGIAVDKSASVADTNSTTLTDAGDTISYSFTVTNTGNVPLTGVSVSDPAISSATISCTPATLPVGEQATCGPVDYTITALDAAAGSVENTATASGRAPGVGTAQGATVTGTDSTSTAVTTASPSLVLVKELGDISDTNSSGLVDAGDTVTYTFTVTNTGNQPIDSISVSDPRLSSDPLTCVPDSLPADDSVTATCTGPAYTITADDEGETVSNTATATGTAAGGASVTSQPDTVEVDVDAPKASIVVDKSASVADTNATTLTDAGDTITYSFAVQNTGNVPLTGVAISDPTVSEDPIACSPADLGPGARATCGPVEYTITADDAAAGSVENTATVSGTSPGIGTGAGEEVTGTDSTSTPVATARPEVELSKTIASVADVNESGLVDAGDTISYAFTVTNTGNMPVSGISLSDPMLSDAPVTCTPSSLEVGEVATCTMPSYTITAADEGGAVTNTATVTGEPAGGGEVTGTDSTTQEIGDPAPGLTLVKTARTPSDENSSGITDAGDTIEYTFTVTNTGNVPLTGVTVSDPLFGRDPVACAPSDLNPGDQATCTAQVHTVTEDDEAEGNVANSATASGTSPGVGTETGELVTSEAATTTTPVQTPAPSLVLDKQVVTVADTNATTITDAGDTITYRFTVKNTGNVPLTGIEVTDPKLGATCTVGSLAVGAEFTCDPVDYIITTEDETAAQVHNVATATGADPDGGAVEVTDETRTDVATPDISLVLVKSETGIDDVNNSGLTDAGDVITYAFEVTNTGNIPVAGITVNDPLVGDIAIVCTPSDLDPGESATCAAASYTIAVGDEVSGEVTNTAFATGTAAGGTDTSSPESEVTTPIDTPSRVLTIDKSAGEPQDLNGSGLTDAGDAITYSFTVTNAGSVPLTGVTVSDAMFGADPIACDPSDLAPGESATCAAQTWTVTAEDEAAGAVANSAIATGIAPGVGEGEGVAITSEPDVTTTEVASPVRSASIEKRIDSTADVNSSGLRDAGDTITYSFVVTNTGTVPLAGVSVTDPLLGGTVECAESALAVGASTTCGPVVYTVTVDDEAAGAVDNSATATGTAPGVGPDGEGVQVVTDPDTTTTPVDTPVRAISLEKAVESVNDLNGSGLTDAGDTVVYTFTITNTGTVPLSAVALNDPLLGGAVDCAASELAPGAETTCGPVTYTVTTDDEAAGAVTNSATATATAPGVGTGEAIAVDPATGTTTTDVTQPQRTLILTKTVTGIDDSNGDGLEVDEGDTIAYSFVVTNTGTVPLTGVSVTDPLLGGTVECAESALAVGASTTCGPVVYTVTVDDEAAGKVDNSATATGTAPGVGPDGEGVQVVTDPDTTTTPVDTPVRSISLVKAVESVNDLNGSGLTDAGDAITYSFTVTNAGNVPLTGVTVSDAMFGADPLTCDPSVLAPGESATCAAQTWTVTAEDEAAGAVANSAIATGSAPGVGEGEGVAITSEPDTTVTSVDSPARSASIAKTAGEPNDVNGSGLTDAGDTIEYTFTVTNTGNVPLAGVTVTDAMFGADPIACDPSEVAPGAAATCGPVVYTVTVDDEAAGAVDNSATATGTGPGVGPDGEGVQVVTDPDTTTTPVDSPVRAISLEKAVESVNDLNGSGLTDAGDTVVYTFTITNTGTVPLSAVALNDPLLGGAVECAASELAPGAETTCGPVTYTVTTDDEAAGAVTNSATATATAPGVGTGEAIAVDPATGTTTTDVTQPQRTLILTKTVTGIDDSNGDGLEVDEGDTVTFGFQVTNAGNVPISAIALTDDLLPGSPFTCSSADEWLAPGASLDCTPTAPNATYTVTAQDAVNGWATNTASVTGQAPGDGDGAPTVAVTSPTATTSTGVDTPQPALVIDKEVASVEDLNLDGIIDAGDIITYTFTVTNPSRVTLTDIAVVDPMLAAAGISISCADTSLLAGASTTCTMGAPYTVTAADEEAGFVHNVASATGQHVTVGAVTSPEDAVTVGTTAPQPGISIEKNAAEPVDANDSGITDAGDTIEYTFVVTNTGNVPLSNVTVSDPLLGPEPVSCGPDELAPGAQVTCGPVVYTITADDESAAQVVNAATASGTPHGEGTTEPDPGRRITSGPDTTTTPVTAPVRRLQLVKSAAAADVNGSGITDEGDTITYTFAVTNTGNVPISGVAVADSRFGPDPIACAPSTLAPGASVTCETRTYTVTSDDEAAGSVENSATASGTAPGAGEDGEPVAVTSNLDATSTPTQAGVERLQIVKTAQSTDVNSSGITDAGDVITYTFVVTNTGNVPVADVTVTDPLFGPDPIACAPATLAPGESVECDQRVWTITSEDEAAGRVTNEAIATGTAPGIGGGDRLAVTSPPDTTSTVVTRAVERLNLVKTAEVSDVNGSGLTDAGDTITYTFVVTNTGNVPIVNPAVSDALLGEDSIPCPVSVLAPGASTTCETRTYTVTDADQAAGSVANSATATGLAPGEGSGALVEVTSNVDTTSTDVATPQRRLRLDKSAALPIDVNNSGIADAGDTITYTFTLTNTGTVPLTSLTVSDPLFGDAPIACDVDSLAPGASVTCETRTWTITTADERAGRVTNRATATGQAPGVGTGDPVEVTSNLDTTTTEVTAAIERLLLTKTAAVTDVNGSGINDEGDEITYTFVVLNLGNVPISAVTVSDAMFGDEPISCGDVVLNPGDEVVCETRTHTVTAEDEAAGSVANSAIASGRAPGVGTGEGVSVTSNLDTTSTPTLVPVQRLRIDKIAADPVDVNQSGITDAGDTVTYTFTVTNTGNVPASDVTVTDEMLDADPIPCDPADIAPGESTTCESRTYTITEADEAAGSVVNQATASGRVPGIGTGDLVSVTSDPDTTMTPVTRALPRISLAKHATVIDVNGSGISDEGDEIVYTFTVTNTGNVPIANVAIEDAMFAGGPIACGPDPIEPGASAECETRTSIISEADEEAGVVSNTATAIGTDPNGEEITSPSTTITTPVTVPMPALELDKRASGVEDVNGNGIEDAGDEIVYTFTVTNTGNVPISNIEISDPMLGDVTCEASELGVGEFTTCTAPPYTLTRGDLDRGFITNEASVIGTDPDGNEVPPSTDSVTIELEVTDPTPGGTSSPSPGGTGTPSPGGTGTPGPDGTGTPGPDGTGTPGPDGTAETAGGGGGEGGGATGDGSGGGVSGTNTGSGAPETGTSSGLSTTGAAATNWIVWSAGLVLAGFLILIVRRRMRQS